MILLPLAFILACSGPVAAATADAGDADSSTVDASDAGGSDLKDSAAPLPTTPTKGLYYGACLTELAGGRLDRIFHFYVGTTFTPGKDGAAISLALSPLRLGAGGTAPATVSKGEVVGATYTGVATSQATASFTTTIVGALIIPGAANPISGRDVDIEGATLAGRFSTARFCTTMAGRLTTPVEITLAPMKNTCVFFPVKDGDAPPTLQSSDFIACPGE